MKINNINKQKGMASIMFAMFIAIVISLIAIGFAVLVRNDQRQTLDKKLSNQAEYAAESAINKKQTEMLELKANNQPLTTKTTCNPSPDVLDSRMPDVKVTCLTWNPSPGSLSYDNVSINKPVVTKILPSGGGGPNAIQSIVINWQKTAPNGNISIGSNPSQLAPLSDIIPTLRITVASTNNIMNTATAFIIPDNSTGNGPADLSNGSGVIQKANCSGSICQIVINNLPNSPWNNGANGYGWISITSINGESKINSLQTFASPNGPNPGGGGPGPIPLADAQIQIDATAMAQDVIKRLQASAPIQPDTWRPGFAAIADKLCKDYKVDGGSNSNQVLAHGACPN